MPIAKKIYDFLLGTKTKNNKKALLKIKLSIEIYFIKEKC